ncbi:MAG: hypothetical protein FJX00_00495 [Alphaproteobacteria bacterium]|nr:hypothetical protein [Alphaproteobacteria bacterium]
MKSLLGFFLFMTPNILFCNPKIVALDTSLSEYPSCSDHFLNDVACEYTLPDLHGNALKLLNALIKVGIVTMSKYQYEQFVDCYFKDPLDVKKKNLDNLIKAVSMIEKSKKIGKIRFIGDELCDRGSNDYYTLLVIKKLSQLGVPYEFALSNHGLEFIQGYETGQYRSVNIGNFLANSMNSLSKFFSKKLVSKNTIKRIVNQYYKPKLKLLSYTASKDQITVYTHAPVGLQQIKKLCAELNVQYKDDNVKQLSKTIDQMNKVFYKNYVKPNLVHTIQDKLHDITWNRSYAELDRPEVHKDYKLNFAHGHDANEPSRNNIYNLDEDNALGKSSDHRSGKIRFLCATPY